MADFLTSTHRHRWILLLDDLSEKRQASNQRAILALKKYGATRVEVQADGSLAYPGSEDANGNEKPSSRAEPLSIDEETLLRRFYEQKIQQVCAAFSFPHKIQATAILYFKRFFLNWSVMEHDPKQIMLTCIYIACKVEEFHVSAEEFGKGIQQDPQAVLKNEVCLLQGLNFDLIVYAPYRSVDGFLFDMESYFQRRDDTFLQQLKELKESALVTIDNLLLTDVILLHPPGQLAIAGLLAANEDSKAIDFDRYLKSVTDRQGCTYDELVSSINAIMQMLKDTRLVNENDVKQIDRKLKYCRNPHLQDESKKKEKKIKHKPKRTTQDVLADLA